MTSAIKFTPVDRNDLLSSTQFEDTYKKNAIPVVLTRITKDWPATQKWSISYFKDSIGDIIVPVYNSRPAKDREHQHAAAQNLPMRKYLDLLDNGENDLRLFFYNILAGAPQLNNDYSFPDFGFKFFKRLPVLFMGGRGAKVQMHFDIDLANIFLSHFGGRKRVYLFSPAQTPYLYRVPFSFSSLHEIDVLDPDLERFPALQNVEGYVATLEHGDTLFIPSGYWHYIVYDDIGYSLTLRSFPFDPKSVAKIFYNIVILRTIEGLMRKLFGQRWNTFNEQRAIKRSNRHFQKSRLASIGKRKFFWSR